MNVQLSNFEDAGYFQDSFSFFDPLSPVAQVLKIYIFPKFRSSEKIVRAGAT